MRLYLLHDLSGPELHGTGLVLGNALLRRAGDSVSLSQVVHRWDGPDSAGVSCPEFYDSPPGVSTYEISDSFSENPPPVPHGVLGPFVRICVDLHLFDGGE